MEQDNFHAFDTERVSPSNWDQSCSPDGGLNDFRTNQAFQLDAAADNQQKTLNYRMF